MLQAKWMRSALSQPLRLVGHVMSCQNDFKVSECVCVSCVEVCFVSTGETTKLREVQVCLCQLCVCLVSVLHKMHYVLSVVIWKAAGDTTSE